MARIAIIAKSFCRNLALVEYCRQTLSAHQLSFYTSENDSPLAGNQLRDYLQNSEAALIGRELITCELLQQLPNLKALSLYGVGFDNVDTDACAHHGVSFLTSPGVNAAAVAEHTLGLILAVLHNIALTDRLMHSGVWHKDGGQTLYGKTVGIIGCGFIGARVAKLLASFDCSLLLHDILDKRDLAVETSGKLASFKDVLTNADIISMHVPLTTRTRGMMNAENLEQMRPGSILINTSRGPVVEWQALKQALETGHLSGAGLDVFETEPMLDPAICRLPQLVATPHIAGNAREAVCAMGQAAVDQLARFFEQAPQ